MISPVRISSYTLKIKLPILPRRADDDFDDAIEFSMYGIATKGAQQLFRYGESFKLKASYHTGKKYGIVPHYAHAVSEIKMIHGLVNNKQALFNLRDINPHVSQYYQEILKKKPQVIWVENYDPNEDELGSDIHYGLPSDWTRRLTKRYALMKTYSFSPFSDEGIQYLIKLERAMGIDK